MNVNPLCLNISYSTCFAFSLARTLYPLALLGLTHQLSSKDNQRARITVGGCNSSHPIGNTPLQTLILRLCAQIRPSYNHQIVCILAVHNEPYLCHLLVNGPSNYIQIYIQPHLQNGTKNRTNSNTNFLPIFSF